MTEIDPIFTPDTKKEILDGWVNIVAESKNSFKPWLNGIKQFSGYLPEKYRKDGFPLLVVMLYNGFDIDMFYKTKREKLLLVGWSHNIEDGFYLSLDSSSQGFQLVIEDYKKGYLADLENYIKSLKK